MEQGTASTRKLLQYGLFVLGMLAVCACRIITTGSISATQTAQVEAITTAAGATLTAPAQEGEARPTAKPSTPEAVAPTPPQVGTPSGMLDRAWLGGFGCGVTLLDGEGNWWGFREESGALSTDQVFDIVIGPSGEAWIADSLGLRVTDGEDWREVSTDFSGGARAIAVDSTSGAMWTVDYRRASVFDGVTWTTHVSRNFGDSESVDQANDVAVDPQGRTWVATGSSVAMFDGASWTVWEEGKGFPKRYFIEAIAAGQDGRIWVGHSDGVLVYDGQRWAEIYSGRTQVQDVAVAPDGRIWAATWDDGVVVFDGRSWTAYDRSNSGLVSDRVRAVAFDGRGRAWLGTTWGLSVFDGVNWTSYTMSTSGMAGPCVDTITLGGNGPMLPQPTPPRVGSLTGLITLGTEPVESASIVLCSDRPGMIFSGPHPCADHPFFYQTSTDAKGRYAFADVPIGEYQATWRVPDGHWMGYIIGGGRLVVREGVLNQAPTIDATPR